VTRGGHHRPDHGHQDLGAALLLDNAALQPKAPGSPCVLLVGRRWPVARCLLVNPPGPPRRGTAQEEPREGGTRAAGPGAPRGGPDNSRAAPDEHVRTIEHCGAPRMCSDTATWQPSPWGGHQGGGCSARGHRESRLHPGQQQWALLRGQGVPH